MIFVKLVNAHIVVGLVVAVANIDEIIRIIPGNKGPRKPPWRWNTAGQPGIRPLIELLDERDAVSPKTAIACLKHGQRHSALASAVDRA